MLDKVKNWNSHSCSQNSMPKGIQVIWYLLLSLSDEDSDRHGSAAHLPDKDTEAQRGEGTGQGCTARIALKVKIQPQV